MTRRRGVTPLGYRREIVGGTFTSVSVATAARTTESSPTLMSRKGSLSSRNGPRRSLRGPVPLVTRVISNPPPPVPPVGNRG